jgi:hypothetical protein
MTKIKDVKDYFVFIKQGYDRQYYCVAGREINLQDVVCFLTNQEAVSYAEAKSKALNESRSISQRKTSP